VACVVEWQQHGDGILSDLCQRFLSRNGLKPVPVPDEVRGGHQELSDKVLQIKDILADAGFEPDYYFLENSMVAEAYKPYQFEKDPEEQSAANCIFVRTDNQGVKEISNMPGMRRVRDVAGAPEQSHFYYVPEACREDVRAVLGDA
jgi:uncharacterized protein